jgi:hypothetical protein
VTKIVQPDQPEQMTFVLRVTRPTGQQQSQASTVTMALQPNTALTINSATVSPSPITLMGNNSQGTKGTNTAAVTFTVNTTGLDRNVDTVRLKYQLQDGTFREIAMAVHTWDATTVTWRHVDPAYTVRYRAGSSQPFVFTAMRMSDNGAASVIRNVVVS